MIHTFETRLNLNSSQQDILNVFCNDFSHGCMIAWSMKNRLGCSKSQIYKELTTKYKLTSKQAGSVYIYIDAQYSAIRELKKHELKELFSAIEKRSKSILDKQQCVVSLQKKIAKNKKIKSLNKKDKFYYEALKVIDLSQNKIKKYNSWINHKKKILIKKQAQLLKLEFSIKSGNFSVCFGTKKLFKQRPTEFNKKTTPYLTVGEWESDWNLSRNNFSYSVGEKGLLCCNPEFHYDIENKLLKIRLNDKIALDRMKALEKELNLSFITGISAKESNLRMKCRFLKINNIEFKSHKGLANEYLKAILSKQDKSNKTPLTYRVIKRETSIKIDGKSTIGYYLQVSFNTEDLNMKINHSENIKKYALEKNKGVLGVDLNVKGLAWTVVKPDGNRLVKNNKGLSGFIHWDLDSKSTAQAKHIIENTCHQIVNIALEHEVGISIENLDFSNKKLEMKSGYINKSYNKMLSSLCTTRFKEFMQRLTHKKFINLYIVNPMYSSVGGFVKYGLVNHVGVDIAASHWLARQALYGQIYKEDSNVKYIRKFDEVVTLPYLSTVVKQSKIYTDELKWKDIALALGYNRKMWSKNLHDYKLQVGKNPLADLLVNPFGE